MRLITSSGVFEQQQLSLVLAALSINAQLQYYLLIIII